MQKPEVPYCDARDRDTCASFFWILESFYSSIPATIELDAQRRCRDRLFTCISEQPIKPRA